MLRYTIFRAVLRYTICFFDTHPFMHDNDSRMHVAVHDHACRNAETLPLLEAYIYSLGEYIHGLIKPLQAHIYKWQVKNITSSGKTDLRSGAGPRQRGCAEECHFISFKVTNVHLSQKPLVYEVHSKRYEGTLSSAD